MKKLLLASLAPLIAAGTPAHSKTIPLEEATITRTINDVRVLDPRKGSSPARVSQVIKDDMGVRTGIKSRAELLFQDNTLTRLGAESYFSFRPGTREMSLDSGTLLLQVPKDHGGATIRAASITASVTGTTIMIENIPNKSMKVLVLEGSLRISMNNRIGEALSIRAGKMIILNPGAKSLPDPVNVNLRSVIKTSSLINPELFSVKGKDKPGALPSMPLIAEAAAQQDMQRKAGKLQDTNLVILGKGTTVTAASNHVLDTLSGTGGFVDPAAASGAAGQYTQTESGNSNRTVASALGSPPDAGATTPGNPTGTSQTTSGTATLPGSPPAGSTTTPSTVIQTGENAISSNPPFTPTTPTPPPPPATPRLAADGAVTSIGTTAHPHQGDLEIETSLLQSSGLIAAGDPPSGAGGMFSAYATGKVKVEKTIEVSSNSPTRMSGTGGTIHLESLKSGSDNGIEIKDSAQLLSLLNSAAPGPGGHIEFVSFRAKIKIGGKIEADRGAILVSQNGTGGQIELNNTSMAADVIKVSAMQACGVLTISKSHLSATNLLQLYGGSGTGGVYFKDNTLLDGAGLKLIAGREVQISDGKVVTIGGGAATLYTDKASYSTASGGDGSKSGRFANAANPGVPISVTRLSFSARP